MQVNRTYRLSSAFRPVVLTMLWEGVALQIFLGRNAGNIFAFFRKHLDPFKSFGEAIEEGFYFGKMLLTQSGIS